MEKGKQLYFSNNRKRRSKDKSTVTGKVLIFLALILGASIFVGCTSESSSESNNDSVGVSTDDVTETPESESESVESDESSGLTPSQKNAVRSAESYLEFSAFSRQGLIDQLSSEYGEQFPVADATIAVDSLNVDWKEEAVESANSYLEMSGFSCQGLIDQLSSEYGEQFTIEEATYGATQAGIC